MGRLFGTDGVRGRANADLTPELALSIAIAAAHTLAEQGLGRPPVAVVGRDPRASGEMLEAAVVAGLASAGATVIRLGVLPTPGVAYLVSEVQADLGVVISASHNPMPDNGIKLFAAGGQKLPDEIEERIEAALGAPWNRPTGPRVGRVHDLLDGAEHYVKHLVEAIPHRLDGLRVVVDCANGAAADVAPAAYRAAGADVVAIHAAPDGLNINDGCGSTHLESLKAAVVEHRAHVGIAHDGDADRCLAVTAAGDEIDGDHILAILALAMREAGTLARETLVATVMSNLGLKLAMREHGVHLVETRVGDRYVLEALRAGGYALGGEQSGHVVVPGYSTTGDGILTAMHVLSHVASSGRSLAELASVLTKLPQVLINVPVADRDRAAIAEPVADAVRVASAELGEAGRILLRPSGTEQLVRVMVEAPTEDVARTVAGRIAELVRAASPTV